MQTTGGGVKNWNTGCQWSPSPWTMAPCSWLMLVTSCPHMSPGKHEYGDNYCSRELLGKGSPKWYRCGKLSATCLGTLATAAVHTVGFQQAIPASSKQSLHCALPALMVGSRALWDNNSISSHISFLHFLYGHLPNPSSTLRASHRAQNWTQCQCCWRIHSSSSFHVPACPFHVIKERIWFPNHFLYPVLSWSVLVSVNLTRTRITWIEGTPVELPPSDWPMARFGGIFLTNHWHGEAQPSKWTASLLGLCFSSCLWLLTLANGLETLRWNKPFLLQVIFGQRFITRAAAAQ